MPADTDTPLARVKAAIQDKPPKSLQLVRAADVQALTDSLAAEKQNETTRALAKGAAGAVDRVPAVEAARKTVYIAAEHLAVLVEAVNANPQ